jgi:hypothetical protein
LASSPVILGIPTLKRLFVQFRFLSLTPVLLLAPALVFAQTPATSGVPAARPDSLALARKFTTWFYTAQFDSLLAHSPAERQDSTARRRFTENLDQLTARAGTEVEVIEERFAMRNGRPQYWRTAKFSNFPEPIVLRWVIDGKGELVGMGLSPLSQAPPIDPPK